MAERIARVPNGDISVPPNGEEKCATDHLTRARRGVCHTPNLGGHNGVDKGIDGKRATSIVISAAVGFICLFSASPAAADDTPIAIANRIVAQFVDGYNRRDASALESLYSSNAMLLPMGYPEPVMGEEEIHAYFEKVMKQMPPPNYKIVRSEVILLGPKEMVQGGTWSSDTLHTSGTYLAVIGKVGEEPGEWKLIASTWNAMPGPGLAKDASNSSAPTQSGTSTPDK